MDTLNNLNVVIGVIGGIFGIGGSLFGIVSYLRGKVASSQQKQTTYSRSPQKQTLYQVAPEPLSKLDWMEVLWQGLEDCVRAREGLAMVPVLTIGVLVGFATVIVFSLGPPNGVYICIILFWVIFFTILILFYVYFVGRRIEMKVEAKSLSPTIK